MDLAQRAVNGVILDFDGLIIDTEGEGYRVWQEAFAEHGIALEMKQWLSAVGHAHDFDPSELLRGKYPHWQPEDLLAFSRSIWGRQKERINDLIPLPGVLELIEAARSAKLPIGLASNADEQWVENGLQRLKLRHHFDTVWTCEMVEQPKPHPAIYQGAARSMGLDPAVHHIIVFEDSEPGVLAARAAGLYVIAVPNQITRHQDLSAAHEILPSILDYKWPAVSG